MRFDRRLAAAIVTAALVAGAVWAGHALDRRGAGGHGQAPATMSAPSTTGTETRGPAVSAGPAGLATLPIARRGGRILYTTPGCRLRLLDLATGRAASIRPDLSTCRAYAAPPPDLAVSTGTGSPGDAPLRIAIRSADDRRLGRRELFAPVLSRSGTEASCIVAEGEPNLFSIGTVVVRRRNGDTTRVPGCSPAWWHGELVRIDRSGSVVGPDGRAAIRAPAYPTPSAIGASSDGSKLIVVDEPYEAGSSTALVFDRPRGRAIGQLAFRVPLIETLGGGQVALPTARISNDGEVAAAEGTDGRWQLARLDRTVPRAANAAGAPILDVAFAPDGSSIAVSAAGRIVFLDPATLAPVGQLPIDARSIAWER